VEGSKRVNSCEEERGRGIGAVEDRERGRQGAVRDSSWVARIGKENTHIFLTPS
jgi:hypothetical protein